MKKGFVLVRKPGKLPGKCVQEEFVKEYGKDIFEIQEEVIEKGKKVVIIDDILATGGTALCAINLIKKIGVIPTAVVFLYEINSLKGREKIPKDVKIVSLAIE